MSFLLREVRPDSASSHSNDPNARVNAPTLSPIAEKNPHKGLQGPKRRHGVTALQALDLHVAPEYNRTTTSRYNSRKDLR
jgi:hypothetical protein